MASLKVAWCKNHTFCSRGLIVENSVVFFAPLIYNARSEFKQKSTNSNFRKSEAKQIKSVYHRTKIMIPQLLLFTKQSPFWSLPVIYGRLLSRTRANWEINLHKERHHSDSKLFFTDLTTLWQKAQGIWVEIGRIPLKADLHNTTFSHATNLTYAMHTRACIDSPPVGLSDFSQVFPR